VPAGGLANALPPSGWLPNDEAIALVPVLRCGSKQERHPRIRSAHRGVHLHCEEGFVFIIGIDPHKGSHSAAVIDGDEQLIAHLSISADRSQRDRLLHWAAEFEPRLWAIEGATGTGALLAQQLVAAGQTIVDVPAALSARARLLDSGRNDKTDSHDARSAAIVALRHRNLRAVTLEDHRQVLRLLAQRYHQLIAGRTRAICRLHAVLCVMIEGGLPRNLSAERASMTLRTLRPTDAVSAERKLSATEFLDEVRRHDRALTELRGRIKTAVAAANTSVTDMHGVGPIVAAYLLGYSGDIRRFASAGHYARYNATAPIEASSGPRVRHRLNPNGNRQLNHAIHIAALGQISHDTPGRAYYLRKQAEGKSRKEAMRALKRRISDAVYARLRADATPER
jgi:transposase